MLHILLALLLMLQFPAIPYSNPWLPLFELEFFDEPAPQAFAVHGGKVYVLDPEGLLHITQNRRTTTIPLEGAHQTGSLEIDGDDLVVLRNMIPLDNPREILRFSKIGELVERITLPGDPVMGRPIQLTTGDEFLLFPQTVKAGGVGGRYVIYNSDGRRWLFSPGEDRVTAYPNYTYTAGENHLDLYLGTGHIKVETRGRAVNVRRLGQDQQGVGYWTFTDFHDQQNQRQVLVRTSKGRTVFANLTPNVDSHLNTWVSLDPETGHIYTANTSGGVYSIHRLASLNYSRHYPTWNPQPARDWYNADTDSIMARQLLAALDTLGNEDLLNQKGRNSSYNSITRSQVWERALSYVNYQWILNLQKNGANPVNEVVGMLPRWIDYEKDGSIIRGVPYCWGGSVTLDRFEYHLSQGWQAGNILPQGGWQGGTTGVDCSGFIWNCYGYPTRPGGGRTGITSPFYWTKIPNNQLVWMDMVRKPGHVVLFITREPNNPDMFYTIEATGAQANDRVMMWYRYFSEGFQGLRYNGLYRRVSETPPEPCPGGQLFVVHKDREEIISQVLEDGAVLFRARTLETVECSKCGRHWIRQASLSDEYP